MTEKSHKHLIMPFIIDHWFWFAVLIIIVVCYLIVETKYVKYLKYSITNAQLTAMINDNSAYLLDIRPEQFYDNAHIKGSVNCDIEKMVKQGAKVDLGKDKPIVIISGLETDCLKAISILREQGYSEFKTLRNCIQGWKRENLPFEKTEKKEAKKKAKARGKAKNAKN